MQLDFCEQLQKQMHGGAMKVNVYLTALNEK
jgi:hypothetical protein